MHFTGSIIITDPCYIIKPRYDYRNDPTYPKWDDYFVDDKGVPIKNLGTYIKEAVNTDQKKFRMAWIDLCRELKDKAEKEWELSHKDLMKDDWYDCDYGENMEVLGIQHYLTSDTCIGDWSCTTFESDTNKVLGQFCADAGLVSVFLLEEVLAYNPDFDYHIKKPWTTTLIENFDGEIDITNIKVPCEDGKTEDCVSVVGGGNVKFYTMQTGF